MRFVTRLLVALALFGASVSSVAAGPSVEPAEPEQGCQYYDPTSHNLCEPFLSFWQANGGLPVFGYPVTEAQPLENRDTGETYDTQYFERERLEYHPENAGTPYEILLGRLGHEVLLLQGRDWTTFEKADPSAEHYYAETGHAIAPQFWEYWSNHGLEFGDPGVTDRESLALFGLPLSEPQMETNSSGDTVLTQWFERARFEFHPDSDPGLQVKLGLLGNEVLASDTTPPSPPPDPDLPNTGDEAPVEGDVIYQSDLSDWPEQSSDDGAVGSPLESSPGYSIVGPASSVLYVFNAGPFGDASYSLSMFSTDTSGDVTGCLVVRADAERGAYHLCLAYSGGSALGTLAFYLALDGSEDLIDLGTYEFEAPRPAVDLHTVKLIAQGERFWFFADGQNVGSTTHSGSTSGLTGLGMICIDETDVCGVGFTNLVVRALQSSDSETPPPEPPDTPPNEDGETFGDGIWLVGEDIEPGIYRSDNTSDFCYWARLSSPSGSLDDIIANETSSAREIVEIKASDYAFETDGCGTWSTDLSPITESPTAGFGDGKYFVGSDIAPGLWRNSDSSDTCYWARLSGFGGTLDEILANNIADVPFVVEIDEEDTGFVARSCGTWTYNPGPITSSLTADISGGTYIVGLDIQAGVWETDSSPEGCYWARLSGFSGELRDIEDNQFIGEDQASSQPQRVTISSSDAGFFANSACGTWHYVR